MNETRIINKLSSVFEGQKSELLFRLLSAPEIDYLRSNEKEILDLLDLCLIEKTFISKEMSFSDVMGILLVVDSKFNRHGLVCVSTTRFDVDSENPNFCKDTAKIRVYCKKEDKLKVKLLL